MYTRVDKTIANNSVNLFDERFFCVKFDLKYYISINYYISIQINLNCKSELNITFGYTSCPIYSRQNNNKTFSQSAFRRDRRE